MPATPASTPPPDGGSHRRPIGAFPLPREIVRAAESPARETVAPTLPAAAPELGEPALAETSGAS